MNLLANIHSPNDIKTLSDEQLKTLSDEIRLFMIDSISKTGGHLASNLGVVELTLALHKVFNTPKDKIVWDVGHQCYVHKILTGRKESFHTLRQKDGLSGFPKSDESIYDTFNTGHSSTSISAALGMAKARDLKGEDSHVVAVIGDGALTGGMAFEALNHAGQTEGRIIVILNDNQMSIVRNVGGIAKSLNRLRTKTIYYKVKKDVDLLLHKIPKVGAGLANLAKSAKDSIRYVMVPGALFEELGFKYIGPVDGHDVSALTEILTEIKNIDTPVLLHVCTTKGKGYEFAESRPDKFHGISNFNISTGLAGEKNKTGDEMPSASCFGDAMCTLALEQENLVAITASMPSGTGLTNFSKLHEQCFFDVGIAEPHAVTFAAGLAKGGFKPVVAIYSSFLQRAYDQVLHDVCLQNLPVVFALDRADVVGSDGETHHGIFDLSYLSHMPNISILAPACAEQLKTMLRYAVTEHNAPIAIRYPRMLAENSGVEFKYAKAQIVREGNDITVVAVGNVLNNVLQAAGLTERSLEIIALPTIKPLDTATISRSVQKTGRLAVVEGNCVQGGAGSLVQSLLPQYNVLKIGYPIDDVPRHASVGELLRMYGLDAAGIAQRIDKTVNDE